MGDLTQKLDNVVVYLLQNLPSNPTRTKLMKLLYLADLQGSNKKGETITGASYYNYFYGPYSDDLMASLNRLKGTKIDEIPGVTSDGQEFYLYSVKSAEESTESMLTGDERRILKSVAKRYGDLPLKDILSIVYRSDPFRTTKKGSRISF
jgi:uncharacterized protein YwgA